MIAFENSKRGTPVSQMNHNLNYQSHGSYNDTTSAMDHVSKGMNERFTSGCYELDRPDDRRHGNMASSRNKPDSNAA